MSPGEAAKRVRRVPGDFERQILRGIRVEVKSAQKEMVDGYRRGGITRTVFGQKPSGLYALVRTKVSAGGLGEGLSGGPGTVQAKIQPRGLALLVEVGGSIKAHAIRAKGGVMSFLAGGARVFARAVRHPGGKVPKNAQLPERERKLPPRVQRAGRVAIDQAVSAAGLK